MRDIYFYFRSALILSIFTLGCLYGSASSAETATVNPEKKSEANPISNAFSRITQQGWMSLDKQGNFHPEKELTRAELARILVKTFDLEKRQLKKTVPSSEFQFQDVPRNHWAFQDIQTVLRHGVMSGYKPGYFYPNQPLSRAEAFAIFAQADGLYPFESQELQDVMATISDRKQIPQWAERGIATAVHERFVNLEESPSSARPIKLRPEAPFTRGDMAFTLNRFLERAEEKSPFQQLPPENQ
ncbi:MAG: S-layer homology domain-containing protein [Cyanobacteria bacterium]|nr:S-layer homology domain-containing protein [Cyanobacteriota bacterium]